MSAGLLYAESFIAHIEPGMGGAAVVMLSSICPPAAAAVAIGEIVAFGLIGYGMYHAHKKSQQNKHYERYPIYNNVPCNCGGKPPKHEDNEKEHPHGIYEDAGYHHQNSGNGKSQCPRDGQRCLDNSFGGKGNSEQRVSIEGDNFVVLKKTGFRKYHGYCVTWDDLHISLQRILMNNGLVTHKGKIIKEVVSKVLK